MSAFSASDAALEGFNLIRRRWRVVLGWAGFNLLSLVMLAVLTAVLSLALSAAGGGARGAAEVAAGLAGLATLFVQAIIADGVFRLELRPEEPGFLHLRLGGDELRLIVVWLITLTGAWVVGWAAAMLGHALGVGGGWIDLLAAVLGVYLGLRFLLAAPISFAERRVDFMRSWRLTRGRVGALLGMSVLSFFLVALVLVVVFVALGLVAGGVGGLEGVAGLFGGAETLKRHPGLYLLQFAVDIVLIPALWALGMAPLAAAYKALAEGA